MATKIALVDALIPRQANDDERAMEMWLHGKSEHSQRAYRGDLERFRAFCELPLREVTLGDLQRFGDSLSLAPASRKRALAAIKSLLTFCVKIGYCRYNAGAALTVRKAKNTMAERILEHGDVVRIIEREDDPRNHALLALLYETGARVSEACGLKWRDVQVRENGRAQVTVYGKGDKTRHVLISQRLAKELRKLRGDAGNNDPVFASKTGKHLDQPAVFRIVQAAARRAGIEAPVSPHWFRHAAASHALDNGAPISLVKDQLGHSSLEITSVYAHARPNDGLFRYLR